MIAHTHPDTIPRADPTVERWDVDPARSSLTFTLRHIVVQQIRGRFERWGGTLFVSRHEPWLSSVEIWVDLASGTSDDPQRDTHVRSPEFLDVARFPRARFRSTDVRFEDERLVVEGTLDLHGVICDVELRATFGPVTTGADGRQRRRYMASGTIDRQSFGLHWNQDLDVGGVVLGDIVEIAGDVEVVRSNGPATAA